MPPVADYKTILHEVLIPEDKLHAICMVCGENASRTQRLINGEPAYYDDPIVLVGGSEAYEARCRAHHQVPVRSPNGAL